MQRRENNELCAIVLQYYSGMHVYSRKGDFDPKEISELIKEQQPSLVCGMEETLSKLYGYVEGYEVELGKVLSDNNLSISAKKKSMERGMNAHLSKPVEVDKLYAMLYKMLKSNNKMH